MAVDETRRDPGAASVLLRGGFQVGRQQRARPDPDDASGGEGNGPILDDSVRVTGVPQRIEGREPDVGPKGVAVHCKSAPRVAR